MLEKQEMPKILSQEPMTFFLSEQIFLKGWEEFSLSFRHSWYSGSIAHKIIFMILLYKYCFPLVNELLSIEAFNYCEYFSWNILFHRLFKWYFMVRFDVNELILNIQNLILNNDCNLISREKCEILIQMHWEQSVFLH